MRKFILSTAFALFVLGFTSLSHADARPWWRGRGAYYYYPTYSYPPYVPPGTAYYYTPGAGTYVAPNYYYGSGYYYPNYGWRRGWWR
jgi:hypothetical protein